MKDKLITAIIPNIHRNMLLFLGLAFFVVFFTFVALLEGFQIDHLRLGGIKIDKLYLKWENALLIRGDKIDLSELKTDNTPISLEPLSKLPPFVRLIDRWVESIDINTIQYQDISLSLHYHKGRSGVVALKDGPIAAEGHFTFDEDHFMFNLPRWCYRDANLSGTISVALGEQLLRADITMNLAQMPPLRIEALGQKDVLSFTIHSEGEFHTVAPLVDWLEVDADVRPWIVDYVKADSVVLHRLQGKFSYAHPEELIRTLQADATVYNGEYTFAQGIDPIKAPSIDLRFADGKLYITPQNGTFYSLPTEESRLWIDFDSPHTLLKAFINTHHAVLNDSILGLLSYYSIKVPIKQIAGESAVDLNLSVDLHTLDTQAKGEFRPTDSKLLLEQVPLDTQGGVVRLDGTRVTFEDFNALYGGTVARARVNGEYDASSAQGIVAIDAYEVIAGSKERLSLYDTRKPLKVTYRITPEGDSLEVQPSIWNLMGKKLSIGAFKAPFDYHKTTVSIRTVPFSLEGSAQGSFSATFDGVHRQTDARMQIDAFDLAEIKLLQSPLVLTLHYSDAGSTLRSPEASAWSVHQLPLLLSPFEAVFKEDTLSFEHLQAVLGDIMKGEFTGIYDLNTGKGKIRLGDMVALNPKMVPLIEPKESVLLSVDTNGEDISIDAESLKAHFTTMKGGWKIGLEDISLLSKKSPLLRRYNIDNGYLNLFYTGANERFSFDGEIRYPYQLMLITDEPQARYRFSGSYQDGNAAMRVNDRLNLRHTPEGIAINAKNAGINLPELFRFLSDHTSVGDDGTSSPSESSEPIRIHATNTYLYLMKNRKIIADTLDATINDSNFDALLRHMNGTAVLKIRNDLFSIGGNGFNDQFMQHLFAFSDFEGGTFSFEAKGESQAFDGLMRVENTILKDYKVLNNVLAFVNTVPSLATFSLPNYNTKGLPLKEGYAHFSYNRGKVDIDNFTLNSPEMKIAGEGNADLKAQTLNATLTLKTDLGSKLAKVPMVGYILFGNDGSIATTLTIHGKLDNPKVETAIAKEIATAPFNILKRTLVYPFLWMIPDEKKK